MPHLFWAQNDNLYIGDGSLESSAIMQIDAQSQGVLLPQMTSTQRNAINAPTAGLLVFDITLNSFWFYDGNNWIGLGDGTLSSIQDSDNDTKIWTEKINDEDIIRFDIAGQEFASLDDNVFKLQTNADFLVGSSMFGGGQKMFYDSSKEAFRCGEVDATQWDDFLIGQGSFAFGKNTVADKDLSAAWGEGNLATGKHATASGYLTDATEELATSFGFGTLADANYATAMGYNTEATDWYASSFGTSTEATGYGGTSMGFVTKATGLYSTAMGSLSQATGANATAMGLNSVASGKNATAIGEYALAESFIETAIGRFNTDQTPISSTTFNASDRLFVVGNGTSTSNRADAFEVRKNGKTASFGEITLVNDKDNSLTTQSIDLIRNSNDQDFGYTLLFNHSNSTFSIYRKTNSNLTTQLMYWNNIGHLRIGSSFAFANFGVGGQASKPTTGAWFGNSDRRLKKNIKEMNGTYALSKILSMQGVHYEWNNSYVNNERPKGIHEGFIAQDLQKLWPDKVIADELGYLQTAYGDYDPMFIESFKAQDQMLKYLKLEQTILSQNLNEAEKDNLEILEKLVQLQDEAQSILNQLEAALESKNSELNTSKVLQINEQ